MYCKITILATAFFVLIHIKNIFRHYLKYARSNKGKRVSGMFFSRFYESLIKSGLDLLQQKVWDKNTLESIFPDFKEQLAHRLQKICIRSLIVEMHDYDNRGDLKGKDSKEKYEYFCKEIIEKKEFKQRTFARYPVLHQCTEEAMGNMAAFYTDIINCFQKDRQAIQQVLCQGKEVRSIRRIKGGFSDVHNKGRCVVRVLLDNGAEILYKPRSMDSEKRYAEMLQWLARETGISQYDYAILSFSDHSWCSIVDYVSCDSREKLEAYYQRLGVQLFLTYLLGTKDLHCENIIVFGSYPVLIDLETLTNIRYNRNRVTANDELFYQLSQSVLYTGILPFYHWNQEGKGVNSSVISGTEGQQYPFKVPVIIHGGTSDMRIAYRHPESVKNQNLATIRGEFQEPLLYKENLQRGFRAAYLAVMEKKEKFYTLLRKLEKLQCRYLVADTQRYSMVLSGSYHPRLLGDQEEREHFLYSMQIGRKKDEKEIVNREVKALTSGDIPYFYYNMNAKNLFDCYGGEIKDYFMCEPIDLLYQKLKELCKEDMRKQCGYIELALEMTTDRTERFMNRVYRSKEYNALKMDKAVKTVRLKKNIELLTERVLQNAVWNCEHNEVSWYTVQFSNGSRKNWSICPMNMYLYDGLAGMLLLMYSLRRTDRRTEIDDIYENLKKRLFRYTDSGLQSLKHLQNQNTGIYDGESSVIYTYLLLYQEGAGEEYLDYAQRHVKIIEQLMEGDAKYDLLSGNAGAVQALLLLYEIIPDKTYLEIAESAADMLEKAAEKQERGIGWTTEEMPPMAGAAHGNGGILIAFLHLWHLTSKDKYEQLAEKIWAYEESLYNPEINNWMDVRTGQQKIDDIGAMAWCHGAPGILYSRMKCYKYVKGQKWKERLGKDVDRAYKKLREYWRRDSWCLCHGICGNLWILEKASEVLGDKEDIFSYYLAREDIYLLPQEKENPGLLNGYGGILLYLCKSYEGEEKF